MYRILIVEDDATIASLVRENLEKWGFGARCVTDFERVEAEFAAYAPHLVLMDVSLPCYNGYYWCAQLRKRSKAPILFLSSHSENMDIVMAVNMGGDDYIAKPFSVDVLIAKINALLRRCYSYTDEISVMECRGALLDPGAGTLQFDGKTVELTKNELRILRSLFESKNRVVPRDAIMKALWNSDCFVDDNTLTVNVNRLRAKLAEAGLDDLIVTRKGEGYMVHDLSDSPQNL